MFRSFLKIKRPGNARLRNFDTEIRSIFNAASLESNYRLGGEICGCSKCANLRTGRNPIQFQATRHHSISQNHRIKYEVGRRSTHTKSKCNCNACLLKNSFSTQSEARKTCLHDLHVDYQGKVVNFAGWRLPVQYKDAIAVSHQHTRMAASLFDVGHMLQTNVSGRYAGEFLESLTTSDLKNLPIGSAALTVFTNDQGGILDDLIITKDGEDKFFVVSNAGRRDEDSKLLLDQQKTFKTNGKDVSLEFLDPLDRGLVALQGPKASKALQNFTSINLNELKFMQSVKTEFYGSQVRISRCGYTGEDGFEISLPQTIARQFVEALLSADDVKLAGLGARDSLRLEAGLCLYGHDIDETTTPVEAGLTWVIGELNVRQVNPRTEIYQVVFCSLAKRRRAEANFPGAQKILSQIKSKPSRRRVGLLLGQGPPAREGAALLTPEGEAVGRVTSGGPSPTLGRPIAMGYLPIDLCNSGAGVLVQIRGKTYKATVAKMPFVKTNYYTGK